MEFTGGIREKHLIHIVHNPHSLTHSHSHTHTHTHTHTNTLSWSKSACAHALTNLINLGLCVCVCVRVCVCARVCVCVCVCVRFLCVRLVHACVLLPIPDNMLSNSASVWHHVRHRHPLHSLCHCTVVDVMFAEVSFIISQLVLKKHNLFPSFPASSPPLCLLPISDQVYVLILFARWEKILLSSDWQLEWQPFQQRERNAMRARLFSSQWPHHLLLQRQWLQSSGLISTCVFISLSVAAFLSLWLLCF